MRRADMGYVEVVVAGDTPAELRVNRVLPMMAASKTRPLPL